MSVAAKRVVLLTAQSADETFSQPINVEGYTHIAMYIIANGTVSSGAVTYGEAILDPDTDQIYSGTWATIGSAVTVATTGTIVATHFTVAAYSHVQARISTIVAGGGTITVVMVATT